MSLLYSTSATADHAGRNGSVRSADGLLDVALAMPKELGGAGGATNPEQLFAAGYAACFTGALLRAARETRIEIGRPQITVHVELHKGEGGFDLAARIDVALPEADKAAAETAVEAAHKICPYSRATRSNLPVEVVLVDWKGAAQGAAAPVAGA